MSTNSGLDIKKLVELRHELHSLAEVSGEEEQTASRIIDFLKSTDPDTLLTGLGGHGVLAGFEGKKDGPTILIRCELDALPIPEENDIDYRSGNPQTGHKCGHDGHMAIICGVAQWLGEKRPKLGDVLLLFQPAEETGEGARRVLQDQGFKDITPDWVFALHNLPGYEKGQIVVREKAFAAASIGLIIRLKGETSHAAHPDEGKSPAMAMSHLIGDLSSLPQFHTGLAQAAKATVIHARLGERAFGTSPGFAEVMMTLRTYDDDTLEQLKQQAVTFAKGHAETYNLGLETEWVESFSATVNDTEAVEIIRSAAKQNEFSLLEKAEPFSWSEDFGHFTDVFPGAMFGLGAGIDQSALHASDYDFPDDLIETGVKMFAKIIEQCMAIDN
ncbi:amidohydrolase [Balneolaceae bacterium YR4-1]|uniref:Amidohydrolase n=1 Tax=Halalkalibaculum roseum TaxID=2709311 RepID=A0A6M1T4V7_9BACT|nr:amidohydrolase [Halalkalibaculum roseum]NGP77025.1 amidohydrolase [Halalkalibaculum roseum]